MNFTAKKHTIKKAIQEKSIRLPLFGRHDCYMDITIQEYHEEGCLHQPEELPEYTPATPTPSSTPFQVQPTLSSTPESQPKTLINKKESVNASDLIPNNEIDKLNTMLTEIIQSKIKTVSESVGDITHNTECSCSSLNCSCVKSSKITKPESKELAKNTNSNLPKPISSLTNKDSKKQLVQVKPNANAPVKSSVNDFPLEGQQEWRVRDDIEELAKEIYSPEEREKKLRLLRLLIQEAIPTERTKNMPLMSKTIEIPHSIGADLKKTDSLIIRIIVEK